MYKPIRKADLIIGGTAVKQGEIFTLGFQLFDANGLVIVPTVGQTITVKVANKTGVVFETVATVVDDHIEFTVDENIGAGKMRVELTVADGANVLQKYPANGYIELYITASLDDIGTGTIYTVTAAEMFTRIEGSELASASAVQTAGEAVVIAEGAVETADAVRADFDLVVAEAGSSNPEVVLARGEFATLEGRLDDANQQLVETSQKADTLEANQPNLLNKNLGGTVTAPVTFNQNVTFVGTTTGYNPTTSTIDNQFYKVNSNVVGAPVLDGGIEVERGTDTNVFLSWNETNKSWEYSDEFGFKQAVSPEFSGTDLIKDKELKTVLPYLKERAIDYGFKHDVAAYKNAKYGSFLFPLESELITNIAEGDTIQVYAYIKTNFANQARLAARFKNSGGTYIGTMSLSKLVRKTNDWMQVGLEIVVPVGASVLDIGISNSLNDASVFTLLAIPSVFKGRVPAPKLVENVMKTSFTQQFQKTVASFEKDTPSYFDYVSNLIRDPFTKTKIKTIGDSITAGVGGTGYSTTGPLIFTDVYGVTRYRNVTTATCWANSLKTYLETRIAKVYSVGFDDPHFELKGAYTMGHDTDTSIGTTLTLANLANREGINFDFYGDGFTMLYNKRPESGKLTIYVDDVLVATVDAYNSAIVRKHPVTISGLTLGNHKVKIKESGSKNASSTGYSVTLECIQMQKHIQVENWGISGITSKYLWEHKDQYIQADDDIYIIQIGTNDRSVYPSASGTVSSITKFTQYCLDKGVTPLLMSANPVQAVNDNNVIFNFRLFDVDIAVKESANRFMMPHISNYQLYWDYEDKTGLSMDTLLNDQLHPNDAGYKVYFENVLKHLKLPRIRTGVN